MGHTGKSKTKQNVYQFVFDHWLRIGRSPGGTKRKKLSQTKTNPEIASNAAAPYTTPDMSWRAMAVPPAFVWVSHVLFFGEYRWCHSSIIPISCKRTILKMYRQSYNIRRLTSPSIFPVSFYSCLCAIYWSHVSSRKWRCNRGSTDTWCSNYIWMITNSVAY